MARAVIVVGGTGAFGERLVRGLLRTTSLPVIIAARDLPGAAALASTLAAEAAGRVSALRLDAATIAPTALRGLGAFALVDAAGPFQHAGYRLAEAAIAAGLHYLDLADGRDFVAGFGRLDAMAKAAGVLALTGASSTPALSHAVLDHLTVGWRGVERVDVAIAPGNRAPRGRSVVRAILSYAGQPVMLFLDGRWEEHPGWGLTVRRRIDGLGPRFLSLCDTPDLDLLPARFAVRRAAVFRAGLELPALHLGLLLASLPVRQGWLRSLAPLAEPFRAVAAACGRFGSDRGGMEVSAEGEDAAGNSVRACWTLVAEAGDGPVIPTLPALAVLRALAAGRLERTGAMACAGVLDLASIAAEFAPWQITTRTTRSARDHEPLFAAALGPRFALLPAPIRAVHAASGWLALAGEASVEGAATAPGRWLARLFGFPPAAATVAVRVTIAPGPDGESWTRDFGGRRLRSRMQRGERPGRLRERFGPFSFNLAVSASTSALGLRVEGWRIGRLPLPAWLAPHGEASETVDASGRFRFDVPITVPWLGRLVRYRGWLAPEAPMPGPTPP
jgi:Domain of unknown function (DUF4166)/Saccharopine dehydrogenase NADP binding domain